MTEIIGKTDGLCQEFMLYNLEIYYADDSALERQGFLQENTEQNQNN
jgi:hypothetical protein